MNGYPRSLFVLGAAAALAAAGCGGMAEAPDGKLGAAALPQIDSGTDVWREITLTFADGTPMAAVFIFNDAIGTYQTGWEYWYVNRDSLTELGSALDIAYSDHGRTTMPSPPTYTHRQTFQVVQDPTGGWGTEWTTDPLSGGTLYNGSDPTGTADFYLRLFKSSASPPVLTEVAWYQILPCIKSPSNITPDGTFSAATSVTVPAEHGGYDIHQLAED